MKILHVIPSFAPAWQYGGPIYAALYLTRELAKQGHSITVFTTDANGEKSLDVPVNQPVLIDGVQVFYFKLQSPRWWYFSSQLWRACRDHVRDFEIIHAHSIFLWPTTAAAFWARQGRLPFIVRPAGALDPVCLRKPYEPFASAKRSQLKKEIYFKTLAPFDIDKATALHYTTQAELENARPLGLRPEPFVVPLGVNPTEMCFNDVRTRIRDRFPELHGKSLLVFLSRLDAKKGLEILLTAVSSLRDRDDFALIVAGSGEQGYVRTLTSRVESLELQQFVKFIGMVSGADKWALLNDCDLFALPSYQENFGLAVLEAMGMGLPVIISENVNLAYEVRKAFAGVVIDLSADKLARSIRFLLDNPAERRRLGENGRRLVLGQFTWTKVASTMSKVYSSLLQNGHIAGNSNQ